MAPPQLEVVRLQRKANRDRQGNYLASGARVAELIVEYITLAQQGKWKKLYEALDDNTQKADTHPNAVIWALLIVMTQYANGRGHSLVPVFRRYAELMRAKMGSTDMAEAMRRLHEAGVVLPEGIEN